MPDVSFVAGARRGQLYGFRFCESFAQFAAFGLHFSWQAQDATNLMVSVLRKLRTICSFWFFFSLHCRTSARHCRSTTGMSEDRKQNSPKAKANKNKHTTKQRPQNQTRQRSREICKKGETGETSASLSSPSQVLFRQVVLPHVVHV